jgi:hypothetical protein
MKIVLLRSFTLASVIFVVYWIFNYESDDEKLSFSLNLEWMRPLDSENSVSTFKATYSRNFHQVHSLIIPDQHNII